MLSVAQASTAILTAVEPLPAVRVPLADALGLVLVEDAISDLDSPPFDKALMDGYAVRSADVADGRAELQVIEEVFAGQVARKTVAAGQATRIMTGAPIPEGADVVVPVEHTRTRDLDAPSVRVTIETTLTSPGRNILPRGASVRAGTCVLHRGSQIRAQELGCLAELGKDTVSVYRRPRVAVLATGDELVPVGETPGPGQIRNSNETMLVAQLRQMGAEPLPLGVARDNAAELRERITVGLQADVLLLSGGVSAGKLDLVPGVLEELGVRQIFHKVSVKPGQPLWFGVAAGVRSQGSGVREKEVVTGQQSAIPPNPQSPNPECYVFGLPGNPVSSMVCCELFVRTAIRRLMGIYPAEPVPLRARLTRDYENNNTRPTYHPAKLEWTPDGPLVHTVRWIGSADLSATVEANCMALFPPSERVFREGEILDVFPW